MKTSDLITVLVKLMSDYGDLTVEISSGDKSKEIKFIGAKKEGYYLGCGDGFETVTKIQIYTEDLRPF